MIPNHPHIRSYIRWSLIGLCAHLLFTWADAYHGDQGYWQSWINQLKSGGLGGYEGNYPPVYVLWLWAVSKIYLVLQLPVETDLLLKFLCLWPVYAAQQILLWLVWKALPAHASPAHTRRILALTALNPALILDGPVWGQIDLFPSVFVVFSLFCLYLPHRRHWVIPAFLTGLLTKFQMIAFLPVLGALVLRHRLVSWKTLLWAIIPVLLVLVPFLISGNLGELLRNAYLKTTEQYPYATYNAGNLWMLVQGNTAPDSRSLLFWLADTHWLKPWFSVRYLGIAAFALISLWIFISVLRRANLNRALALATLNALAFFTVLPGMHERYLIPAVPVSLLWAARDSRACFWATALTALAALNIAMINGIRGDMFWFVISSAVVISLPALFFSQAFPRVYQQLSARVTLVRIPLWFPYAAWIISLILILLSLLWILRPIDPLLRPNQIYLHSMVPYQIGLGQRAPVYDRSTDRNPLSCGGRRYARGLGVHAPSTLTYVLPADADSFSVLVGLDDEVGSAGQVVFRILLDQREVWRSPPQSGSDKPLAVSLSVRDAFAMTLIVETDGPDSYDHANWLLPILTKKNIMDSSGQISLLNIPLQYWEQSYQNPRYNRSANGNPLFVGGRRYERGLGVHAPSRLTYIVPDSVQALRFSYGLDDEAQGGLVRFQILQNSSVLWSSDSVKSGDSARSATVAVSGKTLLHLVVDPLGSQDFDHANWLDPVFIKR